MSKVEILSELATRSILLEVSCHPKPGLVTPTSKGSHKDMDYFLFLKSTAVLSQGFRSVTQFGYDFCGECKDMLKPLRSIGIETENRMFNVTNGVNTQKGLVFLFFMLLGASGYVMKDSKVTSKRILYTSSKITKGIVERELASLKGEHKECLTKGERIFLDHGYTGIRGEVENGLPSVVNNGLPIFTDTYEKTQDLNTSCLQTLLSLMTVAEDTNIISRGGIDVYNEVREKAKTALDKGGVFTSKGLENIAILEDYFIKKNISPGGSADLLCSTLYLYFVENELF